jgi:hypothetical protein
LLAADWHARKLARLHPDNLTGAAHAVDHLLKCRHSPPCPFLDAFDGVREVEYADPPTIRSVAAMLHQAGS